MNRSLLRNCWLFALAFVVSGCADNMIIGMESGDARFLSSNFITFEHPFTDKATADVLARAERLCGERKLIPVQTERACSLTKCTTSYQCIAKAEASAYGLREGNQ